MIAVPEDTRESATRGGGGQKSSSDVYPRIEPIGNHGGTSTQQGLIITQCRTAHYNRIAEVEGHGLVAGFL